MSDQPRDRINTLRSSVERASAKVRNAMIALVTVGLYVFVVTLSTNHRQILEQSSVPLPIINASVPIAWFAVIAPAIVIALISSAVSALVLLSSLNLRLEKEINALPLRSDREFEKSSVDGLAQGVMSLRSWRQPFPFVGLVASYFGLAMIPLIIILTVQIRFLPLHSVSITWIHRITILIVSIVILFLTPYLTQLFMNASARMRIASTTASSLPLVACIILSSFVLTVPGEAMEELALRFTPNSFHTELPARPGRGWDTSPWDRAGAPTPNPRKMLTATYTLLESPRSTLGFRRNIYLPQGSFVLARPNEDQLERLGFRNAWKEYGAGITLVGRDLRYADLSGADLRKADLRAADLTGADLREAKLDLSQLDESSNIPTTTCKVGTWSSGCRATLRFANISGASLRYARLNGADLTAVNASESNFEGAELGASALYGGDFRKANFSGANLFGAHMSGLDAQEALFAGTKMTDVKAFAANFTEAVFVQVDAGSNFPGNFAGSTLTRAVLAGAGFRLDLVDGTNARIVSTYPPKSHLGTWRYAHCWIPTSGDINLILARITDPELRLQIEGALKIKVQRILETNKGSENCGFSQDIEEPVEAYVMTGLLNLACQSGGSTPITLGVLRRIALHRWNSKSEPYSIFEGSEQTKTNEVDPWDKLEINLADLSLCPKSAAFATQKISKW